MRRFVTEFYDRASGCRLILGWADERQYLLGRAFLDDLTGGRLGKAANPDWPDCYILETVEQREAMAEFRRKLREGLI
jgi:hypothetical protein